MKAGEIAEPRREIRIVILEDRATDAELTVHELERAGFAPHWVCVSNEEDFAAQLTPELDLILADFQLPQFDGLRAIDLARERVPGVPVIIISGSLGDETAAECIKRGAADYLLKDRLGRLGPAVTRVLESSRLSVERSQAEDALAESERRFREMLGNVDLIAIMLDTRGVVTFCNDYLLRLTGWWRDDAIGANWFDKFLPPDEEATKKIFFSFIETGMIPPHYENSILTRDGRRREIIWSNTVLRDGTGKILGTASIGDDVTDRRHAESELRRQRAELRVLIDHIPAMVWFKDTNNTILHVNRRAADAAGKKIAEIEGRTIEEIFPPEMAKFLADNPDALRSGTAGTGIVEALRTADGNLIWVQTDKVPYRDEMGNDIGVVVFSQEITERKRTESRTELQHAVTRVLAEPAPLVEVARRILEIVCRTMDWEIGDFWTMDRAAKALRCVEVWHPPSSEFLEFAATSRKTTFAEGASLPGQVWASRQPRWIPDMTKDKTFVRRALAERLGLHGAIAFPIKLREKVFGVMVFYSVQARQPDPEIMALFEGLGTQIGQFIERQQLEEQYRQSQKMEAVGTLAGGIAHDFNNILAAINGYAQLAKMEAGANATVKEYLDAVLLGARRATDLVRQIMAFSRQQEQQRSPIQLRHIVTEAVKLLRATIPSTIEIKTSFARDLPPALADATQVHQVVMNLSTNAWHAMKDRPGRLEIALEDFEVDANLARDQPDLRPGRYVRLSVSDTGHGMDKATLERIFEPFFTTKAPGEGTGLGLAVVHGIMRTHDGAVTVSSQPGEGTKFHLYFPAHLGPQIAEAKSKSAPLPQGKGERILYLDDEKVLADMGGKILERLGYRVEIHCHAAEALAAFRARPGDFSLVVTDMTMPTMTGIELTRQLLQIRADLPVILTTGYTATLTSDRIRALGIRELVLKPLSLQSLSEAVQRALHGEAAR